MKSADVFIRHVSNGCIVALNSQMYWFVLLISLLYRDV